MRILLQQVTAWIAVFAVLAVVRIAAAESRPAATKSPPPTKNSLDDELLKSLDNKLLEGLDDQPATPAAKASDPVETNPAAKPDVKPPVKEQQPVNPLDDELRKSLGGDDLGNAGEDVGENQLTRIARQMRSVEQRLANSNSDARTQQQQKQIAAELAALIDRLRKQHASAAKSGSKPATGVSGSKPGQPKQPSGNSSAGNPSNQPARDSSPTIGANRSDRPDPRELSTLLEKAVDGLRLPEKDRQQMLQAPPDEFLPKFEFSIKKYFERIVEEEGDR